MFKFSNITKLFKYDWKDVFKNILPKGRNGNLTEEEQNTLKISSILGIVASFLVIISSLSSIYNTIKNILGTEEGFFEVVNIGKLLWTIIKCSIIPIGVLLYNMFMGKKEQNGWVIFIMNILVILWSLYSFYIGITCIRFISVAPISVILGFIGSLAILLAGGNMMTVFIDYSERCNGINFAQGTIINSIENGGNPEQKICPKCGYLLRSEAEICTMCGYNFEEKIEEKTE